MSLKTGEKMRKLLISRGRKVKITVCSSAEGFIPFLVSSGTQFV